jgi:hypothetical protein
MTSKSSVDTFSQPDCSLDWKYAEPGVQQPATLTAKVLQAGKEAVTNPLSQYHLGAGYALNWCEAAHYIGRESVSG